MGDKNLSPAVPSGGGQDLREVREDLVLAAASGLNAQDLSTEVRELRRLNTAAHADLIEANQLLKDRTWLRSETPVQWASRFSRAIKEDVGRLWDTPAFQQFIGQLDEETEL